MAIDRERIDRDGRHSAGGLTLVEQLALEVLGHLPGAVVERTRDVIQLTEVADEGIVVLVTREALELRLPTVEWTMGAHGLAGSSRSWRRLRWDKLDQEAIADWISRARVRGSARTPVALRRRTTG